jgi:tRNA(Ile)-lysidine synthase
VHAHRGGRLHLRPLLGLKKAEIAAALRGAGAAWREDSSNRSPRHFRNRLRASVMGVWTRASGRDAAAGAARTRELLAEDDQALEAWVDGLDPVLKGGALSLARVRGRPRAVLRRALHRWLLRQGGAGELSRQGFDRLLAAVERGLPARHSLGRQGFAVIRSGRLGFERAAQNYDSH